MRRISVFGATGSVGESTFEVLMHQGGPATCHTVALTGARNVSRLAKMARALRADIAVTADEACLPALRDALTGAGHFSRLAEMSRAQRADIAVTADEACLPALRDALTGARNVSRLAEMARAQRADIAVTADEACLPALRDALTGARNVSRPAEMARALRADVAVTADEACPPALRDALAGSGIAAAAGPQALAEAASRPADRVMSAIVGAAGLQPGLLALANKQAWSPPGP